MKSLNNRTLAPVRSEDWRPAGALGLSDRFEPLQHPQTGNNFVNVAHFEHWISKIHGAYQDFKKKHPADDRSRRRLTAELNEVCGYPYELAYVGPSQPQFINTDTRQSFHDIPTTHFSEAVGRRIIRLWRQLTEGVGPAPVAAARARRQIQAKRS